MAFKNAIKILFNSFSLLWSLMFYIVLCGGLVLSLVFAALQPLLGAIEGLNIVESLTSSIGLIMTGDEIGLGVSGIVEKVEELWGLFDTPSTFIVSYLMIVAAVGVLGRFVINLSEAPISKILDLGMSSKMKARFSSAYIGAIGKSCKLTLFKMIFTIPFDFIMIAATYLCLSLLNSLFFIPYVILVVFTVGTSFKHSTFIFFTPEYITSDKKLKDCFINSTKLSFSNFGHIFSTMLFAISATILVNIFFGLFTFGAGLIITAPLSVIFLNLLSMTLYYEAKEKRYYLDDENIYTPRKKTANSDI